MSTKIRPHQCRPMHGPMLCVRSTLLQTRNGVNLAPQNIFRSNQILNSDYFSPQTRHHKASSDSAPRRARLLCLIASSSELASRACRSACHDSSSAQSTAGSSSCKNWTQDWSPRSHCAKVPLTPLQKCSDVHNGTPAPWCVPVGMGVHIQSGPAQMGGRTKFES